VKSVVGRGKKEGFSMTLFACPKCGSRLIPDSEEMCPDCRADAEAARQKSRAATGRKAKAFGNLAVDMTAALAPIFKPIWEMTLAKPITALFVILIAWSMLSGPSEDPTPTRSSTSSPSPKSSPQVTVTNSGWDGSVWQVEHYLKYVLKDPDSFQAIEWGRVGRLETGFLVRCRYRAKNSFGGYVIEEKLFEMDKNGDVISVSDWGPQ